MSADGNVDADRKTPNMVIMAVNTIGIYITIRRYIVAIIIATTNIID